MHVSGRRVFLPLTSACFLGGLGCTEDGSLTVPENTGTIEVTTLTIGTELDPDGYTIQVDDEPPRSITATGSVRIPEVRTGSHSIQLAGLQSNCAVGENPVIASVIAGETLSISFEVTCGVTTGALQITATTTGASPDGDGYDVTVDGVERGALVSNGQLNVDAIASGQHLVGVSGVAGNCQVQGENPRPVEVTAGASAIVAFVVTCNEAPPSAGTLRITAATSGPDADPDGYTIAIDGGPIQPIGINAAVSLTNVAAGNHSVLLGGLAANCSAQGDNPRTAGVTAGGTAEVTFSITCAAATGTVQVTVSTSGSVVDEVYTATLDGSGEVKRVNANESVSFSGVPAGSHSVVLSDIAPNCTVADGATRSLSVTAGQTQQVTFAVSCTATTGSILVRVTASGSPVDENGFTVKLDQGTESVVPGSGGSVTFSSVSAGSHTVALNGVAEHCSADPTSRNVAVEAGVTAEAAFTVTCSATDEGWSSIALPAGFQGSAVWAGSPEYILVAGSYSGATQVRIIHYDGNKWNDQFQGQAIGRASFGGSSTADLYAVLGSQMVLKNAGGSWEDVGPNLDLQQYYVSVWPFSGQIFAGGFLDATTPENGVISHYTGSSWTAQMPGHEYRTYGLVYDLSGVSPSEVYALGQTSPYDATPEEQYTAYIVSRYDGNQWTTIDRNTVDDSHLDYPLSAIWASATNDVFVVGGDGHIDRYNGTAWTPMSSPTDKRLHDIWANSASNVYAVGDGGVLHYNGASWEIVDPSPATRVWGTAAEVFVLTQHEVRYARHEVAAAQNRNP